MSDKTQKSYRRLDKADRVAIENGLDKQKSCRQMANELGRSPSTIADEVSRNRVVCRGAEKGEQVIQIPEDACPKLATWPHCCNGCKYRRYHCTKKWRCEYSAPRAQNLAEEKLTKSRAGVDMTEERFEYIMNLIRFDISRGLSPQQIAIARAKQVTVSSSTIYRWISKGYAGMSNLDLRRKCGYKPRSHAQPTKPTAHGEARSFSAFERLGEEERACACEMDTVIGLKTDHQCLLTLYLKPFKFQLVLLMPDKTTAATKSTLDELEKASPDAFRTLMSLILTDNGVEFANCAEIEHSALENAKRCSIYYCDVRQSQQKGSCERNHVEVRKILPKGKGISFDRLTKHDCATIMSHLNSEPRPSLGNMCAIDMLLAALGDTGQKFLDALGIKKIAYEQLLMSVDAIETDRRKCGMEPLVI